MSEDKPMQELLDNMFEGLKERLPVMFDGRNRESLKLDQNIDMEARGTQLGHRFRFQLDMITQSVRHLSLKKGRAEARDRSESRYMSALRLQIQDTDSMSRIARNSDTYVDKYGRGSLIVSGWSSLTEFDKEELELYAVLNGLDIRRTE